MECDFDESPVHICKMMLTSRVLFQALFQLNTSILGGFRREAACFQQGRKASSRAGNHLSICSFRQRAEAQ